MIVAGIDLEHDDLAVLDRYDSTYGSSDSVYDGVAELTVEPSYQGHSGHHYDCTEVPFCAARTAKFYAVEGVAK